MNTEFIGNIASSLRKRNIISQPSRFSLATMGRAMTQVLEDCIENGSFEEELRASSQETSFCVENGLVQVVDAVQVIGEEGELMDLRRKYYRLYDEVNSERVLMWQGLPDGVRLTIMADLSDRILGYFWKGIFREKWERYKSLEERTTNLGSKCFHLHSAIVTDNGKYVMPMARLADFVRQFEDDDWHRSLDMDILVRNWDAFFDANAWVLGAVKKSCEETEQTFEAVAEQYVAFVQRLKEFHSASYDLSYLLPAISRTAKVHGDFGLEASREHKTDLAVTVDLESAARSGIIGDLNLLCYGVDAWNGEYNHLPHEYWKIRDRRLYKPNKEERKQGRFKDYVLVFQPGMRQDIQSMVVNALWEFEKGNKLPVAGEAVIGEASYIISITDIKKGEHAYNWYYDTGETYTETGCVQESGGVSYAWSETHPVIAGTTSKSPQFEFKLKLERT